jgi:hypothetical protein
LRRRRNVSSILGCFPFVIVGISFTILGSLKLYGVLWGIEGGRDKTTFQYVCGT